MYVKMILLQLMLIPCIVMGAAFSNDINRSDARIVTVLQIDDFKGPGGGSAIAYIAGYGTQKKQKEKLDSILEDLSASQLQSMSLKLCGLLGHSLKAPRFKFALMTSTYVISARWGARTDPKKKGCVATAPCLIESDRIAVCLGGFNLHKRGIAVDYQEWLRELCLRKSSSKKNACTVPLISLLEEEVDVRTYVSTCYETHEVMHEVLKATLSAHVQERETLTSLLAALMGSSLSITAGKSMLNEHLEQEPKIIALRLQLTHAEGTVAFEGYRKHSSVRVKVRSF